MGRRTGAVSILLKEVWNGVVLWCLGQSVVGVVGGQVHRGVGRADVLCQVQHGGGCMPVWTS